MCGNYPYQAIEVVKSCKALHWYCDPHDSTLNSAQPYVDAPAAIDIFCFERVSDNVVSLVKQQLHILLYS